MKKIFKLAACILIAYFLILVPYIGYFIRSVSYDPSLGMPMDHVDSFYPTYSSFIWSAVVGVFFYICLHGRKNVRQMHEAANDRKGLLIQTAAGTACIIAVGCVLEWYGGEMSNICGNIYYAISNTKQCIDTGTEEQLMHITIIAQYFERAIIPDLMKMMNLLVVFLFYQGMPVLSALHINNIAAVRNSDQ